MEPLYQNVFVHFSIKGEVLVIDFNTGVFLNVVTAKRVTDKRLQFQNGKVSAVLWNITNVADSNKAGRDYLAKHSEIMCSSIAVYSSTPVSMTIAKFYMRNSNHRIPNACFSCLKQAFGFLDNQSM